MLSELTPQDLGDNSEKHPQTLARLLALVPKSSREALRSRKFRREMEREDSAQPKLRDPNKPFGGEDDHRAVVRVVDHVLGIDRFKKQMMEADAAAGRPWPSQIRTNAAKNVPLANSADGAPVSNPPSRPSSLTAEVPSADLHQAAEPPPAQFKTEPSTPEVSPVQPEATPNPSDDQDCHTIMRMKLDGSEVEELPWNWNELSEEYLEKWKQERIRRKQQTTSSGVRTSSSAAV